MKDEYDFAKAKRGQFHRPNVILAQPAHLAPTAIVSKKVRRMLGLSLHGWENAMVVCLIIAGFFALIAGAATWAVVRLQRIEIISSKDEFERYKLETGKQIAEANERAALLEKDAAIAKLELARLTTPRFKLLTTEAVASLVQKMEPFKGTKFDIGHARSGREQWDFLWQLEPVFAKAGWMFVDWVGPKAFGKLNWTMEMHAYGEANVVNVAIELSPQNRDVLLPAAEALVSGLNSIGIAAEIMGHPISGVSDTTDAIHILVGSKE